MDSKPRDKSDSSSNPDTYNESLDWIRSMNFQMKSPGNFISSRLESVSLEQVHREFSSLLLTSQSHGSSLLRTAFTNASSYNDNLKKIIMSLWPIKDKVTDSYNYLKNVRDELKNINDTANTLLNRLQIVLYTKLAISTLMQAQENFNNLCEEVIDTFSPLNSEEITSKHYSKLSHVSTLIEMISKKVYNMNTLVQNIGPEYNLESNWVLLEFAPKEIKKINELMEKFKYYDKKIGTLIETLSNSKKTNYYEVNGETKWDSNVHMVVETECRLDSPRSEKLNEEFGVERLERDVKNFSKTLGLLIEVCANIALTKLYKLYREMKEFRFTQFPTNDDTVQRSKTNEEINMYLSALVSIIKGHRQLNNDDTTVIVNIFKENFMMPFMESDAMKYKGGEGSKNFTPFQDESNNFEKFVDSVENDLLNPNNSIMMKFLEDLSELMEDESFKSRCVLECVAKAIFNTVEESYSSIFTPIYPENYSRNYEAFERLLTILETKSDKSLKNVLKWRGSKLPYSFSTRFCTGVICQNYVEKVCSEVYKELEKHHELDGNFHKVEDKRFYLLSSSVVYKQIKELLEEREFFDHLYPQYLEALDKIFKAYINHVDSFITHMESTNKESSELETKIKWQSGLSFAYSAYVLHDVMELLNSLKSSPVKRCRFKSEDNMVELGEEYGSIPRKLLRLTQKPVSKYLNLKKSKTKKYEEVNKENKKERPNKELENMWNNCLSHYYESESLEEFEDEFERDVQSLFMFTVKAMKLIEEFINGVQDHMNFVKDKLEQYIVSSLYNSSRCSLQFIQSLASKYRTSNKHDSYQVSDYVKFLVAPILSFNEFSLDILSKEMLKNLMLKTIQLVSSDYKDHILNLLKSVENLNLSLTKPKNISLNEYSESFLIVDMEMLRKQISSDVGEFYEICVNSFKVDRNECSSLNLLLEHKE